jgi:putative glutamine amidotransferase
VGGKVWVTYVREDKLGSYVRAVEGAGLEAVPVSPACRNVLAGCRGLVLTGGGDVNPKLYGETPHGKTEGADDVRDEFELELLERAIRLDLPVLAICRGMQLLNVYCGGKLIQHIPGHSAPRKREAHAVEIAPGTRLRTLVGTGPLSVNSRHHQAAGPVAPGLVVSATSPDRIVEGLERPDSRFVLGVQWHPEDRIDTHPADRSLFEAFAVAVNYKP